MSAVVTTDVVPAEQLERYRRELRGYCYRMLGSIHEAEDAVQDTMLRAWRALPSFGVGGGLRPWLYRIATNVCLDLLKSRSRRALPMELAPVSTSAARLREVRSETTWIEPALDALVVAPADGDPAELAVSRETVRIAFIAALQHLGPRQRAVLILRDVLRFRAAEVAQLLGTSADAVNSSLRRARAALAGVEADSSPRQPPADEAELLAAYVAAFEHHDVDALVALLRDDAIVEMPPYDLWLQGRLDIRAWLVAVDALADHIVVPIRANGSPAVAVYNPTTPGGEQAPFAIHVLDVDGGRISAIHSFIDGSLFPLFGLPDRPAS